VCSDVKVPFFADTPLLISDMRDWGGLWEEFGRTSFLTKDATIHAATNDESRIFLSYNSACHKLIIRNIVVIPKQQDSENWNGMNELDMDKRPLVKFIKQYSLSEV
jgi:hypothetical protein